MGGAGSGAADVRDSKVAGRTAGQQVVWAWALLVGAFLVFAGLVGAAVAGTRWYVSNATVEKTAQLQVVSGSSLLIREQGQSEWRLVADRATVKEGDSISTGPGTVGWLTLFDQGTVEISEESTVTIRRMRTSRFWSTSKEYLLEPTRGTIYVGMAPHGSFSDAHMDVVAGPVRVRMRDSERERWAGSFLVEVQRERRSNADDDPILSVRVAVLRGRAAVETDQGSRVLSADQQTIVSASGALGPPTPAVREMIRNGDFERGLADWIEYQDQGDDGGSVFGLIQRVPVELGEGRQAAVEFLRGSENTDYCETGVQQTIGYTLRVYSSLQLSADIWIDDQQPPTVPRDRTDFPLILKINYVDLQGQPRAWWHGFYVQPAAGAYEAPDRATLVERGTWRHVSFDLRNLTPLPRQISSIVVYSSGFSYKTRVTNLSLTSSEAGQER